MECFGVCLFSWGETIMGLRHDRVMTTTSAEGTDAVGHSEVFVGFRGSHQHKMS